MKKSGIVFLILIGFGFISCFSQRPIDQAAAEEYVKNLTEQEIVSKNSSSKIFSSKKTFGNTTEMSVKRFSGFETAMEIRSNSNIQEVKVDCKVDAGALRVVLCNKEKILHEFNLSETETFSVPQTEEKLYIRIAGKDAQYTLTIESKKESGADGDGFQIKPKSDSEFNKYIL